MKSFIWKTILVLCAVLAIAACGEEDQKLECGVSGNTVALTAGE